MTAPAVDDPSRFGAVILAGGTAARLSGADKASIELEGATLLERALTATAAAAETVVVGEQVGTSRPVTWTREDPRGGGPAAGLLAGIEMFYRAPDLVGVLAVDMPLVTADTFARLRAAVDEGADGAVLVDARRRQQPLCAVYRWAALTSVRPPNREEEHGLPMHRLLVPLTLTEVASVDDEAVDVDTWEDLEKVRENALRDSPWGTNLERRTSTTGSTSTWTRSTSTPRSTRGWFSTSPAWRRTGSSAPQHRSAPTSWATPRPSTAVAPRGPSGSPAA